MFQRFMVIIKTMDKSKLKSKTNYQSDNYQSDRSFPLTCPIQQSKQWIK